MTNRSWIRKLFQSHRPRTIRRASAQRQLSLETLEDRFAPASLGTSSVVEGPAAGADSVVLGATGAWTATSNSPFLHVTTGSTSGSGNALVKYSFDANTGATRTGTLTIAGQTLTVTQVGSTYVAANPMTTLFSNNANSVAVDAAGNVYFIDAVNETLDKWNPATQQVSTLAGPAVRGTFGLHNAIGVAVDATGNVFIADTTNGTIDQWSPTFGLSPLIGSASETPFGVAVDAADHVYYSDVKQTLPPSPYTVNTYKAQTASPPPPSALVSSGLNQPSGVAVDAAGNVYIADTGDNAIKEWNASTGTVTSLVSSGLNQPKGVAVDAAGNVYIADTGDNAIKEWNASTGTVTTLVSSGLSSPAGVAVDAAGDVYIADFGSGTIKELMRAFVPGNTVFEGPAAGSGHLLPVLPTSQSLTGVFAPSSDQSWLTVGTSANGVVNYSYTQDTGAARTGHLTILGQQITVQQENFPVLSISSNQGAVTGNEGAQITNTGTTFEFNGVATETLTASVGTVTENTTTGNWTWSYTLPDSPGAPIPVTITTTDLAGNTATTTFNVTDNNVPPTITQISVPTTGAEGSPVTLSATATLPAGVTDTLTYTWTIAVPPGAGSNITLTGATANFVPPDDGNYLVSLSVSDGDGGVTSLAGASLISSYAGSGNALDVTGANNGTAVGGVTYVPAKVGQAFSLNGTTGYVQLPANFLPYPTSGTGTSPLSFETWFKTSSGGVILGQQPSAAFGPINGGWIPAVYVGTDGHLYAQMFWSGGTNPVVSPGVVNDNQYHHVAVTYNGTTETVYLDGVAIGTQTMSQVAYASSYNYQLGLGITNAWPAGNGGWFPFAGQIDEPTFYSRALSAQEVQSMKNVGSGALSVAVPDTPPTPALTGYATDLATELVTFSASATHPSTTDNAGFTYSINWGDGPTGSPDIQTIPATPGNGSGVNIRHAFTNAGTDTVSLAATDEDGGTTTITRTVTVLAVTSANLQTVISQQGSITTVDPDNTTAQTMVNAVNGLAAQTTPVTIAMQLGSGSFTDTSGSPHAGITLVLSGSGGSTTIVGHSPALQVAGGNVIVENLTLVTDTNSPTLVISGGNVTLRNVDIEGSGNGSQAALDITGGIVDLGTADDPGGNTFDDNGTGQLIHNAGANGVSAVGDTWKKGGTTVTNPYRIKDEIFDALNPGGGGLVTYVPGNDFVSVHGGIIQLGVDAIAAGGTVNVEAGGKFKNYSVGSKPLTIAFQNGPVLTQVADSLNPSLLSVVVTGTAGDDKILFNPGGGQGGTVKVLVNNLPQGVFSPTGRLIAYGGAGNDDIEVAGSITLPAWLYGGEGNDRLKGGCGNNVLIGGAGDNELIGGPGQDLLIGGSGSSTLIAGSGDDLLIAGTTAYDANEAALDAIMAEWTSGQDYATRIADLSGTGTGPRSNGNYFLIASGPNATVFDNGAADVLNGGSGMDWFFANLVEDSINGQHTSETAENL
jgi:streptogramin lyase